MHKDELLKSLSNLRDEAMKNPDMSSEEAQKKLFDAIYFAEQLVLLMKEGWRRDTIKRFISDVTKPYVKTREKRSSDVYNFCNSILGNWVADLNEII